MKDSLDEIQLQRLVDGELNIDQTRRIVQATDAQSDGSRQGSASDSTEWRRIAVAFIEDRLWQRSFQQADQNTRSISTKSKVPPGSNPAATSANTDSVAPASSFPSWLTLAAGLLLAAGLGFFARQWIPVSPYDATGTSSATYIGANSSIDDASDKNSQLTLASLEPEVQLELMDDAGTNRGTVPLYSSHAVRSLPRDERRPFQLSELPVEQRRLIEQSGYRLNQEVDYLTGRLKDGRKFVVPMRTIRLSPGQ